MAQMYKIRTKNKDVFLRVAKGHFATSHSHTNYFIDVTTQKTRLSEAKAVAKELVSSYRTNTIVDTILCVDGTEVIGACVADELTKEDFVNMNAHQTIYVVSPEYLAGGQLMFRDNLTPMIAGKHVLILTASVTTGKTAQAAIDAVKQLSKDVGIPADLKDIVKAEDIDFLSQSAFDDACRPGNPRDTSVEEIKELYLKLM